MTPEEIHKLLGGYAANTLTERERTSLFDAALEDQALFDALHNEDALRKVLADPVTREQVRLALHPTPRIPWMRRPWLIGMAGVASAAIITVAIVISQRKPVQQAAPQIASTQVAPTQIAENPVELKPSDPKRETPQIKRAQRSIVTAPAIPAPVPAPVAAAPAAGLVVQEQQGQQGSKSQDAQMITGAINGAPPVGQPLPGPRKQELTAGVAANAPLYSGPLVRYSLLRSGPSGGAIRIEVVSQVAGYLALYRVDDAGQWQRVYPVTAPEIAIAANTAYQIPESPIALGGAQDKLRLVIDPAAGPSLGAAFTAGSLNQPRAKVLVEKAAAPVPLVVEISIGPN
jgi:hypothetical protein